METSDIYAGLKRFAGKIQANKVRAAPSESVCSRGSSSSASTPVTMPDVSIETIIAMVKEPLTPLKDDRGYIYDTATVAARCPCGHIHRYFITDILSATAALKCTTCISSGNRFTITAREQLEKLLDAPFALNENRLKEAASSLEYINPHLKVALVCHRTRGVDKREAVGDYLVISLHTTTSTKRIQNSLCEHLAQHPHLNDTQKAKIASVTAQNQRLLPPRLPREPPPTEPLPYTPELAELNAASTNTSSILARMQLNIVADDADSLCLENC